MRQILLAINLLKLASADDQDPKPLFLYPQWSPARVNLAMHDGPTMSAVLVQELSQYLSSHKVDQSDLESVTAAFDVMDRHGESSTMWHYIGDRSRSILPPDDPLLSAINDIENGDVETLQEEQLLGDASSGGIRGLIRTLLQLKIAARSQALQRLNGSNVVPTQEILDAIWNQPYKVLSNTPATLPRRGFNVADAYCKAYGTDQCRHALHYGLGTNVTIPPGELESGGGGGPINPSTGGRFMLPGALGSSRPAGDFSPDTTPGPTFPPTTASATATATATSTTDATLEGHWKHFNSSDVLPAMDGRDFLDNANSSRMQWGHNNYHVHHYHMQAPPMNLAPDQTIDNRLSFAKPMATTPTVLTPIVLAAPPESGAKGGFKGAWWTPFENVKKHILGDHRHSHQQPATLAYILPVAFGNEAPSFLGGTPEPTSTLGGQAQTDNWNLLQRLAKSETPIYDGIVRRGNRLAVMTDALAELPVVGPAAVFMNEAANMGRDAMLSVLEVAGKLQEDFT